MSNQANIEYVAAINLGSSKIIGIVARRLEGKDLQIVAYNVERVNNCIKRGCIYNSNETAAIIKRIISSLELKAGVVLDKIYVNVSGQSVRSIKQQEIKRILEQDEAITNNDIESIYEEIHDFKCEGEDVIYNTTPEFYVDDKLVPNPEGIIGIHVRALYMPIVARLSLKKNILKCFPETKELSFIVGPLSTANVTLTEEEKQMGCASVDFGAGTTTLSVYKGGFLKLLAVVPFGGENITKDLCSLGFNQEDAEKIKMNTGCTPIPDEEQTPSINALNDVEVSYAEISRVIVARQSEIWLNVWKLIKDSDLIKELSAGIVITGGASNMKGLIEYIKGGTTLNVRQAIPTLRLDKSIQNDLFTPSCSEMIGMLSIAHADSVFVKEPEPKPEPKPELKKQEEEEPEQQKEPMDKKREEKYETKKKKTGGIFDRIKVMGKGLFDDDDDSQGSDDVFK